MSIQALRQGASRNPRTVEEARIAHLAAVVDASTDAIRCIAGGIPPMLRIKNDQGEETLFILRGENGEIINKQVLSFIGVPVSVTGVAEQVDDWYVLKVSEIKNE
jgi:hypothetical protein